MVALGIIGLGHWGKNYIRLFSESPQTQILHVSDLRAEVLHTLHQKHPAFRTSPSYLDVLENPKVEAIVIATPTSTHATITREALQAGKHVLVEKPIAVHSEEVLELDELAREQERVLMVGHTFLFNNAVRALKELVRQPTFGECYYLDSRRNHLGLIREDVSVHWDLAPHDISIVNYILDSRPISVQAISGYYLKPDRSDITFSTLTYPGQNGKSILCMLQDSWIDAHKVREMSVIGSHRRIVFNDLDTIEPLRIFEKGVVSSLEQDAESFGEFKYLVRDGDIISPKVNMVEPLKQQCEHFITCIRERQEPLTSARNGYEVVKILEAIDQSLAGQGKPIALSWNQYH